MRSTLFLLSAVIVTSALFAYYWTPYAIDDAWITYRYAEHVGAGDGFVYNPGERVLGTSTPLYTLLLAGAHALGMSVPVVSWVVGFAATLGTIVGVFLLTRLLHSELAALVAVAVLMMTPQFHKVATYGMETPLYVCMIVYAFYAYATRRHTVAFVLAAGCLVTRLDGAAVGAALFGAYLVEYRRLPWKHIALYLAIAVPWFAYSQLYFGTFLPNSFLAKRQHMNTSLQGWMLRWIVVRAAAVPALIGGLATLFATRTRLLALPMLLWSCAYVTAYTLSSLWRHQWYFMPITVPLAIFGAIGVVFVSEWLLRDRQARQWAVGAMAVLLLAPDVLTTVRQLRAGPYYDPIEGVRYEVARWMRDNVPRSAVVATGGIGVVGYLTGNYILDSAGLVSPQVIGEVGPDFFLETAVSRFHPDYVLLSRYEMHDFMQNDYAFVKTWPTPSEDVPFYRLACRVPCVGGLPVETPR